MTLLRLVVVVVLLSWVVALAAAPEAAGSRGVVCDRHPILTTAEGAFERAERGWDSEAIKKHPPAIKKVRIQSRCAPSSQGRKHVRHVIADSRREYAKAKAGLNAYGDIDPPGEAYLYQLRQCESGGNYQTNTGNGFSGAYQFMDSTWASVGGSTSSAYLASPDEQDYRAALLWRRSGPGQWPVCG